MSNKIITILEARVSEEHWDTLRKAYRKVVGEHNSIMPVQSFLIQDQKESTLWRIISKWQDMETLQKMRDSGETPGGVRIFQEAEANPTLTIFEVKEEL